MDQYVSAVIIAIVTGIFSIATILVQNKQDKVVDKINYQSKAIKKRGALKKEIALKYKEQQNILNNIIMLILDSNVEMLMILDSTIEVINQDSSSQDEHGNDYEKAIELKAQYDSIGKEINKLTSEYEMINDLAPEDEGK